MPSGEVLARVRTLVREFKEQTPPAHTDPDEVCRYVAATLRVAEAVAREWILELGTKGINPWSPTVTRRRVTGWEPMSDPLDAEHEWLLVRTEELAAETERLRARPKDLEAHRLHDTDLREHKEALALHVARLKSRGASS